MELVKKRFNEKWSVNRATGCWEWMASCAGKGYGQMKIPGTRRQDYAHRISYRIHVGEIPKGKSVLHRCDNPKCVNPAHLFLGTAKDNAQDMKKKGRHLPGEANSGAILSEKDVRAIRALIATGIAQHQIAAMFGIAQITVSRIKRNLRWAHVQS